MTDQAQAFLNYGNVDQWTRGAGPITGIDIFLFATLECVAAARYPAP